MNYYKILDNKLVRISQPTQEEIVGIVYDNHDNELFKLSKKTLDLYDRFEEIYNLLDFHKIRYERRRDIKDFTSPFIIYTKLNNKEVQYELRVGMNDSQLKFNSQSRNISKTNTNIFKEISLFTDMLERDK